MILRIMMIVLTLVFVVSGCGSKQRRVEKIQSQYPQWDQETVQKVAAKRVEIGMTSEMVMAALGKPDSIAREGEDEKWSYGINVTVGWADVRRVLVYFVYLRDGKVVRTSGDWRRLGYWYLSFHYPATPPNPPAYPASPSA